MKVRSKVPGSGSVAGPRAVAKASKAGAAAPAAKVEEATLARPVAENTVIGRSETER